MGDDRCLCEHLNINPDPDSFRLDFVLGQNHKFAPRRNLDPRKLSPTSRSRQNSLTTRIKLRAFSESAKLALAVQLSYSLCSLYGTAFAKWWQADSVVFFGKALWPILYVEIDSLDSLPSLVRPRSDDPLHQFPEILELGTILIEIHLQDEVESNLALHHRRDFFPGVLGLFRTLQPQLQIQAYSRAVEECSKPGFWHGDCGIAGKPRSRSSRDCRQNCAAVGKGNDIPISE